MQTCVGSVGEHDAGRNERERGGNGYSAWYTAMIEWTLVIVAIGVAVLLVYGVLTVLYPEGDDW